MLAVSYKRRVPVVQISTGEEGYDASVYCACIQMAAQPLCLYVSADGITDAKIFCDRRTGTLRRWSTSDACFPMFATTLLAGDSRQWAHRVTQSVRLKVDDVTALTRERDFSAASSALHQPGSSSGGMATSRPSSSRASKKSVRFTDPPSVDDVSRSSPEPESTGDRRSLLAPSPVEVLEPPYGELAQLVDPDAFLGVLMLKTASNQLIAPAQLPEMTFYGYVLNLDTLFSELPLEDLQAVSSPNGDTPARKKFQALCNGVHRYTYQWLTECRERGDSFSLT